MRRSVPNCSRCTHPNGAESDGAVTSILWRMLFDQRPHVLSIARGAPTGRGELMGTGLFIGRGGLMGAGGFIGPGPLSGDRSGTGRSGIRKGMAALVLLDGQVAAGVTRSDQFFPHLFPSDFGQRDGSPLEAPRQPNPFAINPLGGWAGCCPEGPGSPAAPTMDRPLEPIVRPAGRQMKRVPIGGPVLLRRHGTRCDQLRSRSDGRGLRTGDIRYGRCGHASSVKALALI